MQSASSHWAVSTHSVPAHCCWVHVAVSTALHWAGTHGLQAVSCVLQPKSHWVASHGVPQPSLLHRAAEAHVSSVTKAVPRALTTMSAMYVRQASVPVPSVGVKGASIFRYIGENAPNSVEGWTFAGNTTKTVYEVTLPAETPAGSKVWITAYWFNGKMQSGPAATPVSIHIPGGLSVAA